MGEVFTETFIDEQIASLKVQLAENVAAMTAAREAQQYSLDTGQSRQSAQRAQLSQLSRDRKSILEELAHWESMKSTGGGSAYVRPAF